MKKLFMCQMSGKNMNRNCFYENEEVLKHSRLMCSVPIPSNLKESHEFCRDRHSTNVD